MLLLIVLRVFFLEVISSKTVIAEKLVLQALVKKHLVYYLQMLYLLKMMAQ